MRLRTRLRMRMPRAREKLSRGPRTGPVAGRRPGGGGGVENERRKDVYLRQSGRKEPTARQRRRLAKKAGQGKD